MAATTLATQIRTAAGKAKKRGTSVNRQKRRERLAHADEAAALAAAPGSAPSTMSAESTQEPSRPLDVLGLPARSRAQQLKDSDKVWDAVGRVVGRAYPESADVLDREIELYDTVAIEIERRCWEAVCTVAAQFPSLEPAIIHLYRHARAAASDVELTDDINCQCDQAEEAAAGEPLVRSGRQKLPARVAAADRRLDKAEAGSNKAYRALKAQLSEKERGLLSTYENAAMEYADAFVGQWVERLIAHFPQLAIPMHLVVYNCLPYDGDEADPNCKCFTAPDGRPS